MTDLDCEAVYLFGTHRVLRYITAAFLHPAIHYAQLERGFYMPLIYQKNICLPLGMFRYPVHDWVLSS